MRCPNCGQEIWGQGGVCEYCGATLAQPGPTGGIGGAQPPTPQGGWRQVPPPAPVPPAPRSARHDAPPAHPGQGGQGGHERRPSTLGDLFGPSAPQGGDRGEGGPALPRFGPAAGPPTPKRGAPMAAPPTPRSGAKWRVSPEGDGRSPFARPDGYGDGFAAQDDLPPPTRRGFESPEEPPEPDAHQARHRWSAGPLQQFRRQVRAELDQDEQPPPRRQPRAPREQRPPSRRRPVDTAKRLGRRLGLGRGSQPELPDMPPMSPMGPMGPMAPMPPRESGWGPPPEAAYRGPPTPRSADFAQPWQAPQPGAGWDFAQAPQAPAGLREPPVSSQPLGRAWPGAATDLPWQQNEIPDEIEPDYHDTGRGWSIAMPAMQEDQPRRMGTMTGGPRRTGGAALGEVGLALLGRLGRYTFNLTLLAIILAILAIPVSMGLARLSSLRPPAKPPAAVSKTAQPVPTPYAGYTSYAGALFSISYPQGWTVATATRDVTPGGSEAETTFASPDKTTFFVMGTFTAVPSDQTQFTLQAVARAFPGGSCANFTAISAIGVGATLAGHPAIKMDFTCDYLPSANHLETLQATALLRTEGLTTYVVIYAAPRGGVSGAQEQFFNPMLTSLRLNG